MINFDPLQDNGGDGIDYSEWKAYLELSSACCVDFDTFLVNGCLDEKAIKDCTTFLEMVVGRRRDRSANMWGQLLCYMLNLNFCFQCTDDNADTIEWVVQQCTGSALDRCNSLGLLEQFVVAVDEVRHDAGCNPLGMEAKTIFWHNLRERGVNNGPMGDANAVISMRLESVINVIRQVKGQTFHRAEILNAARRETWAQTGRAPFYDTQTQPWPITKTHVDLETQAQTKVPLTEAELMAESLKQQQCLHIRKVEYDRILADFKAQGQQSLGFKTILIKSAFREDLQYSFYGVLTDPAMHGSWPGYGMVEQSNYSHFGGARNFMACGSTKCDVKWVDGMNPEMYTLGSLQHYFSYDAPQIETLPREYVQIPWEMRNADGDEEPEPDFPDEDPMDTDEAGALPMYTFDKQSGGSNPGSESGDPEFEPQEGDGAGTRGTGSQSPEKGGGKGFDDDEGKVRSHPDARRLGPGAALVQKFPLKTAPGIACLFCFYLYKLRTTTTTTTTTALSVAAHAPSAPVRALARASSTTARRRRTARTTTRRTRIRRSARATRSARSTSWSRTPTCRTWRRRGAARTLSATTRTRRKSSAAARAALTRRSASSACSASSTPCTASRPSHRPLASRSSPTCHIYP